MPLRILLVFLDDVCVQHMVNLFIYLFIVTCRTEVRYQGTAPQGVSDGIRLTKLEITWVLEEATSSCVHHASWRLQDDRQSNAVPWHARHPGHLIILEGVDVITPSSRQGWAVDCRPSMAEICGRLAVSVIDTGAGPGPA